jgi:hypothetical protein
MNITSRDVKFRLVPYRGLDGVLRWYLLRGDGTPMYRSEDPAALLRRVYSG